MYNTLCKTNNIYYVCIHINFRSLFPISFLPGSKGVHLEVGGANRRAIEFYLKCGFTLLELEQEPHQDDVIVLGQEL